LEIVAALRSRSNRLPSICANHCSLLDARTALLEGPHGPTVLFKNLDS
jgi:hypothetical protein